MHMTIHIHYTLVYSLYTLYISQTKCVFHMSPRTNTASVCYLPASLTLPLASKRRFSACIEKWQLVYGYRGPQVHCMCMCLRMCLFKALVNPENLACLEIHVTKFCSKLQTYPDAVYMYMYWYIHVHPMYMYGYI